jgi:phosphatidylserine decarboxylase
MIRLAPEGWPFVMGGLLLGAALAALAWALGSAGGPGWRSALLGAAALPGLFALFSLYFFRDPVRTAPPGEELVLAPGDGRVVQIARLDEPTFLGGEAIRISIFLSLFNVHVQRAPLSGRVAHRSYHPGKFLAAWSPKASLENEQASLGIDTGAGRVLVRQIAGLVARRVVTDRQEGDSVTRGERIGLIRFGSRVDLFLPPQWEVLCKEGDTARGGLTVLARIPENEP